MTGEASNLLTLFAHLRNPSECIPSLLKATLFFYFFPPFL
ncbi:MAG: hypothetical protein ACI81P_003417 [Neolewinella sp.]|jgi:hypothetical protein